MAGLGFRSASLFALLCAPLGGCAAQIDRAEHEATLAREQRVAAERQRSLAEARLREAADCDRARASAEQQRGLLLERTAALEVALAERGRLLEESFDRAGRSASLSRKARLQLDTLRTRLNALDAKVQSRDGSLLVTFPLDRFFGPGSIQVLEEGQKWLESLLPALQAAALVRVWITVHADDIAPGGHETAEAFALTQRQGLSLAEVWLGRGLDPSRVTLTAQGPYRPAVSQGTESGRAQNRRLVLYLTALPDDFP